MVLLQQVINGLAVGGIYSLIAIGWTTVFGIVGMINWTHGDVFMWGAFIGFTLVTSKVPFIWALTVASLCSAAIAMTVDRLIYRPLRSSGAPRLALFISALGASIFLRNLAFMVFGPHSRAYPRVVETRTIDLLTTAAGKVSINSLQLMILVVTFFIMAGLQLFITRTKVGKAMLAASQDLETVGLMGVEADQLILVTFGMSGLLGGAAGVLVGTLYAIDPMMGAMAGLKGWAVAVLGGVGSITGSMVSGLLLGIAENLTAGYISSGYRDAIAFVVMILTLLFKPSGLMGVKFEEKV